MAHTSGKSRTANTVIKGKPAVKRPHKDDLTLTPRHLSWLVTSRTSNQTAALRLFLLLETHSKQVEKDERLLPVVQRLVSTCFSLWRAAFLADKTGLRVEVFADAKAFLGKLLTDNAIMYPQDRGAREWTFNYYMTNANESLLYLGDRWPIVPKVISEKRRMTEGSTKSTNRWDRHQKAFEIALESFENELRSGPK